jgi:hypothetical protein
MAPTYPDEVGATGLNNAFSDDLHDAGGGASSDFRDAGGGDSSDLRDAGGGDSDDQ